MNDATKWTEVDSERWRRRLNSTNFTAEDVRDLTRLITTLAAVRRDRDAWIESCRLIQERSNETITVLTQEREALEETIHVAIEKEREACAKIADARRSDEIDIWMRKHLTTFGESLAAAAAHSAEMTAVAIRARQLP